MKSLRIPLLIVFVMSAFSMFNGCTSNSKAKEAGYETRVEVQQVRYIDDRERIRYSGTIEESVTIPAAFAVNGIVSEVFVREGEKVQKGQLLATLDNATFQNAYLMAEATYKRAIDAVERLRPMHENGNLPDIKMVEAETGLQQATAALELAKKNLADCQLLAPEAGVVGRRSIEVGGGAAPGVTAIRIVQINRVKAVITVHENEISQLSQGMTALVSIPALGNRDWEARIDEIGVVADPLSHTYKVKLTIANRDHQIKPGMICNVVVIHSNDAPVLCLPIDAVQVDEHRNNYVFVVNTHEMTVHKNLVKTGEFLQDGLTVKDGLEADDIVVVSGQHKLYENAPVVVMNMDDVSGSSRQ